MTLNTDKLSKTWKNRNTDKEAEDPIEKVESHSFKAPANDTVLKNDEQTIDRKHFALDDKHKTSSVKIMFKGGNALYQPYAGMSYVEYDTEHGLIIHAGKRKIKITGRDLETLADHLSHLNVDWIMESNTGRDDKKTEIFIEKITFYSE